MRRTPSLEFLLPLALAAALVGCVEHAEANGDDPDSSATVRRVGDAVEVADEARAFLRVEPATTGNAVAVLRAPARLAYRDGSVAKVGTPVAGRITEVLVRTGESVQAGQPLLVLRSPDAAIARASVATSRAELEQALAEARRSAEMFAHGVGTDRERREADLRVSQLEIEVSRARTTASLVGRGAGGDVTIRAPIAGVVLDRRAAIGMSVSPEDEAPLVEVGDPATLGAIADVFERDIARVREGASVEVSFPSSTTPFRGHVAYVAPAVSNTLRTVPVRIELDSLPSDARPGVFGRASITLVDQGIVLPSSAVLVRDGAQTVAYVEVSPSRFEARRIEVGPSVDGRVYVMSGLHEGDQVVVDGALLIDGASDLLL